MASVDRRAVPVVTTATDVERRNLRWVCLQSDHGFVITDRKLAKEISADILAVSRWERSQISDFQREKDSEDFLRIGSVSGISQVTVSGKEKGDSVGPCPAPAIPRCVALGIGCKRGTPVEKIRLRWKVRWSGTESICEASCGGEHRHQEAGAGTHRIRKGTSGAVSTFSSEELNGQPGDFLVGICAEDHGTGNVWVSGSGSGWCAGWRRASGAGS